MASNHWRLAIDTHQTNHPDADHDCVDLSQVDPRRYPTTDLLWASPECTNHSQAKGIKRNVDTTPDMFGDVLPDEAADRSRATMWDVPRFAERHRYRAIIVENVVDAAKWVMWPAWLQAMQLLGYEHHVVYLNSMHAQALGAPAPQSRDRMYVVFWRRGQRRPEFERFTRPKAWCPSCTQVVDACQAWKQPGQPWGRYRQQYIYLCTVCHRTVEPGWLPAASAIDWSLPGVRIGDRTKPLAPKTIARIEAGLRKWARPFTAEAAGNTFERHPGVRTWPVDEVLRTLHTTPSKALLVPAGGTWNTEATPVSDVMRTRTTRDSEALLVPVEGRVGKTATTAADPLRTQTARNETGLLIPLRNHNTTKPTSDPLDTIAANGNHHALVMRNNTARGDQGQMSTPVDEVLRTLTTAGHQSLIEWAALYSYDSGQLGSVHNPMPTQTTVVGDALMSTVPDVDDCLFRMLEPHEIQAGMAFSREYVILGNKREKVRQAGNAVTPPAARDLIACVAASLGQDVTT